MVPTSSPFIGHIRTEWLHLERRTAPVVLEIELDRVRFAHNTGWLHAAIDYVPDDEDRRERSSHPPTPRHRPHIGTMQPNR